MASLIVRRLDEAVKDRLKQRAKHHGRSLEAEARAILEDAARDSVGRNAPKGFGSLMAERFKDIGLTPEEQQDINAFSDDRRRKHVTQFKKNAK